MQIAEDKLTILARANWSAERKGTEGAAGFNISVVEDVYTSELGGSSQKPPGLKRIMLLEVSQYLEKYLWPNFDNATATFAHIMSIVLMVNEKFREGVPAWGCFHSREDAFPAFFQRVLELKDHPSMSQHERTSFLMFMINSFQVNVGAFCPFQNL